MREILYRREPLKIAKASYPPDTKVWFEIWINDRLIELSEDEYTDMLVTLIGGEVKHC